VVLGRPLRLAAWKPNPGRGRKNSGVSAELAVAPGSYSVTGREVDLTIASTAGVELSWSAVTNAAGYKIYWDSISGPPYDNSVDVGNVLTYDPSGWGSGTWYANIRSYDESGLEGPWGTEVEVTL
jgi:hypothetical protein